MFARPLLALALAASLTASLAASLAAPAAAAEIKALNGGGGTAIYPVLSVWAQKYKDQTGVAVNYAAIGSGGGIKQISAKLVDFGNSDKPLRHSELVAGGLVQFPQVIITIVPVVNLPGIKPGELTIDGPTLADIYLGKITRWNDPALARLNPGIALPAMPILVVHRSDGSGTTFNFANYLGKVSPEWRGMVGADTSVSWPVGAAGKGNAGVAAMVQQSRGAIGYVEYAYAKQENLTYMDMINRDGKRVAPTMATFKSAASHADFSKVQDFYLILTDQPGAQSWPIVAATYVLMRPDAGVEKNRAILKFFDFGLHAGAADSAALDYVPFPDDVVAKIEESWKTSLHAWP